MENNFDFEANESFEELDNAVLATGEMLLAEDNKDSIINPLKVKQISLVYNEMKNLCKGKDIQVTYTLHQPLKSMGCISLLGKDISFTQTKRFIKACNIASNIDIYPKTDGNVRIDLTFHGLTNPIE